jgi:hypothetical protein
MYLVLFVYPLDRFSIHSTFHLRNSARSWQKEGCNYIDTTIGRRYFRQDRFWKFDRIAIRAASNSSAIFIFLRGPDSLSKNNN